MFPTIYKKNPVTQRLCYYLLEYRELIAAASSKLRQSNKLEVKHIIVSNQE